MSLGRLTKNGSRTLARTPHCQRTRTPAAMATCQNNTTTRDGCDRWFTPSAISAPTPDDFLAQVGPHASIQIDEGRLRTQIEQVARTIERDAMMRHDAACRAGRQHDHLVGERDRLLELV